MIKVGIVGGSGYTGGELIRILLHHPAVEISFIYSTSKVGQALGEVHPDLQGVSELEFTDKVSPDSDVIFLCTGHGNSSKFLSRDDIPAAARIIDLSNDYRLESQAGRGNGKFIYGLPELNKEEIEKAANIANPGCFATAIQLALLPLAKHGKLQGDIHINAITGSTGAGMNLSETSHFSWRNNNISWYKPFTHQHLPEIKQSLGKFQEELPNLLFLPMRGNFTRGILATAYTRYTGDLEQAKSLFSEFYRNAAFTKVVAQPIALKQVVNTNFCHIHLHRHDDLLLITAAIDNLLKGASGQAVQNMNLMFGLEEQLGLRLKGSIY